MKRRTWIALSLLLLCLILSLMSWWWSGELYQQAEPIEETFTPETMEFQWPQWHGPDRSNRSSETGLLQQWPNQGPPLIWTRDGLGEGWSSPTLANGMIFATGAIDKRETIFCLDLQGRLLWKTVYGSVARRYPGTRSTPAFDENRVYVISGTGEVVCIDVSRQMIAWKINGHQLFKGKTHHFGTSESPLVFDGKVFYTPGGPRTTMVALDKLTGEIFWESKSLNDQCAYVSPLLIHHGGIDIIVTVTAKYIVGVNQANGEILWAYPYVENHRTKDKDETLIQNAVTPLYHDGQIFITSGYNHVGVALTLSDDGHQVNFAWENTALDCHHGGVIYHNGFIYGSSWHSNWRGNWVCVDWTSGERMYDQSWIGKGSILYADDRLYCYEEKKGNLALVSPTPEKFDIISSFPITLGTDDHWAHPVICGGRLYIRHGDTLMAYNVKKP